MRRALSLGQLRPPAPPHSLTNECLLRLHEDRRQHALDVERANNNLRLAQQRAEEAEQSADAASSLSARAQRELRARVLFV